MTKDDIINFIKSFCNFNDNAICEDCQFEDENGNCLNDMIGLIEDENKGQYSIDLKEYCDNCPEFEVEVLTNEVRVDNIFREPIVNRTRVLTCKHKERCKYMMLRLEDKKTQGLGPDMIDSERGGVYIPPPRRF